MTNHIDLGTVLRQTLAANLYSNLVTRSTGAAATAQSSSSPAPARSITSAPPGGAAPLRTEAESETIAHCPPSMTTSSSLPRFDRALAGASNCAISRHSTSPAVRTRTPV